MKINNNNELKINALILKEFINFIIVKDLNLYN